MTDSWKSFYIWPLNGNMVRCYAEHGFEVSHRVTYLKYDVLYFFGPPVVFYKGRLRRPWRRIQWQLRVKGWECESIYWLLTFMDTLGILFFPLSVLFFPLYICNRNCGRGDWYPVQFTQVPFTIFCYFFIFIFFTFLYFLYLIVEI